MAPFSLAESLRAQQAMRDELGLPAEVFQPPQLVGMVSDEIEQLRARGWNDEKIAELITKASGQKLEADAIKRHFVEREDRRA